MAPRLGEAGSVYVDDPSSRGTRQEYTQAGQLIRHQHTVNGFVSGSRALIGANMRSFSEYFADRGSKIKAWSFFSGELPGAEMVYQAKQEPEDIVELAGSPLLDENLDVRARDFLGLGLRSTSIQARLITNGMRTIYLVDDYPAFQAEMLSRGELSDPYWKDPVWSRLKDLQVRTFFGVPDDAPWHTYVQHPFTNLELREFEGYRRA